MLVTTKQIAVANNYFVFSLPMAAYVYALPQTTKCRSSNASYPVPFTVLSLPPVWVRILFPKKVIYHN